MIKERAIVMIGMPTSGKTGVGKAVAEKLSCPFFDVDEEIEDMIGQPIAVFMAAYGEPSFRAVEKMTVATLAKGRGCVIATGGGTVLDEDNVRALKQNGVLVFLDRSLEKLFASPDRPLSANAEALSKLYRERLPIYRAAADIIIPGDGTVEETAALVIKAMAEL